MTEKGKENKRKEKKPGSQARRSTGKRLIIEFSLRSLLDPKKKGTTGDLPRSELL